MYTLDPQLSKPHWRQIIGSDKRRVRINTSKTLTVDPQ